jgi:hypothetical protein
LLLAPQALQSVRADDAYSFTTRVQAWEILSEIIKANPILGLGPANYYWYTPLFAISGYYGIQFNSHNQYVDLVAQAGILGLLAYLWFLVSMSWFAWRANRHIPEGFARGYVMGSRRVGHHDRCGALGDWALPSLQRGDRRLQIVYLGWPSSVVLSLWSSSRITMLGARAVGFGAARQCALLRGAICPNSSAGRITSSGRSSLADMM